MLKKLYKTNGLILKALYNFVTKIDFEFDFMYKFSAVLFYLNKIFIVLCKKNAAVL